MIGSPEILGANILIVDDQPANAELLERTLRSAGYTALTTTLDPTAVFGLHGQHRYDLIILDLVMPVMDGFEVIEALKEIEKDSYLPVLVITAEPGHKLRALQAGAKDFISKPLNLAEVQMRVHNMVEVRLLHVATRRLYEQVLAEREAQERLSDALQAAMVRVVHDFDEPRGIVAKSGPMRKVVDLARRVAKVDSTVLVIGESGSGKERIARLLHDESTRAGGPFVAVNCGAIAETLLESEMFGHARGAFTGATGERAGLFEAAHTGTLFLDEIGEVSPGMQVKLLRAIQEREIRRVGDTKNRKVDVRILAATNRDLAKAVAEGSFRQDLFYRLNVVDLRIPALRERRDDILPLARVLLAEAALRMKRKVSGIAPEAADQLMRYDWPGNVRELENAMERAVALALPDSTRVELADLPEEVRMASPRPRAEHGRPRPLEEVEKEHILATLAQNGGNQTHTARHLEIGQATLYRKLKSYGLIGGDARKPVAAPGG
ncbi:MAG: sigma-54-dependent Fis family transcriptional regulator [Holophagaceae bacterium]|nr:sigma-54-dependent Fis family transcriptional regulator [Holophagaceae bacterium]